MPLHQLESDNLRGYCRDSIESLEHWLRRLIDDSLRSAHGPEYQEATDDKGNHVLNSRIRGKVEERRNSDPSKYARWIDAATLNDEIDIICNPPLYEQHFREPLRQAFPLGREEALHFLNRIRGPRNSLSHGNPISVRDSERVLCYSHDVTDSLRDYYKRTNQATEYNAPTILKISDSFGNVIDASKMMYPHSAYESVDLRQSCCLRAGETFFIEVEVDAAFPEDEYSIEWHLNADRGYPNHSPRAVIQLQATDVGEAWVAQCLVIAKREWHRYSSYDDMVYIMYKVLPPI